MGGGPFAVGLVHKGSGELGRLKKSSPRLRATVPVKLAGLARLVLGSCLDHC
jgi:hypothetical protein